MPDLMMTNGDIIATVRGDINIVDYEDDIIQSAVNNIACIYGEYLFHPTIGNMVHIRRNKIVNSQFAVIAADCRSAVMNDRRVAYVPKMEVAASDTPNSVDISFTIEDTERNQFSSNITVVVEVAE